MRHLVRLLLVLLATQAAAQSSLNRHKELSDTRTQLTADFAKIQTLLRSKESAARIKGEEGLSQLAGKVDSLTADLISANKALIVAFNHPYRQGYYNSNNLFFGAYDPSATIIATLSKMITENRELAAITLPDTAPFSPQDINKFQVTLDRLKRAIDEHRHAANNYATTVTQRQRKPAEAAKKPAKLPE